MTTTYDPVEAALARRSLTDFATLLYPNYTTPAHIRLIGQLLERVERGELRRLQISVPVRHGKSVLSSQCFPAWFIGRHPEKNVVLTSHAEELAVRNGRVARHLIEDERWPFPGVVLAADSTAAGRWNTKQGGGLYAVGVGGAITGRGADVLIIDDALHDGLSETERRSVFQWYAEVAFPRLEPGGRVVVIGARFAPDDLCGRILDSDDGPNWEVVNLPAIADECDVLGRKPGEVLWPERMDLAELEMRRVAMGSRPFEAQFQQRPSLAAGDLFKRAWFGRRYREPPKLKDAVVFVDCAAKTGIANDRSAMALWATDGVDYFLCDAWAERVEFPSLKAKCISFFEAAKTRVPQTSALLVEDASSGIALIQELRRSTAIPVVAIKATQSKVVRAESVTPLFEAGKVVLPESVPWLDAWIEEHIAFPGGRHDDQVDTTSGALERLKGRGYTKWSFAVGSTGGEDRWW